MNNFAERSLRFKTFDGYCYVLKDGIVITYDRKIELSQALAISRWQDLKIGIFFISAAFSMLFAAIELANSNLYIGTVYMSLSIAFGLLIKPIIYNSKVLFIKNQDIISVNFYGSRFGRKHSFFEIVRFNNTHTVYNEIFLPAQNESEGQNDHKALEVMGEFL